ncbi:low temperature requirement protein A [Rhizobium sp. S152]|uniref:low temperature requirement protein A n=1 Tax=Rhizobium sp. S152 TaxID=3055038 RepID=UPI0025A96521|nr:low temperature requirement protein A [Rhizobium sp. S152]MDM9627883.1 low temperature requirement protein A [Rhizobium sp. S152]
MSNANRRRRWIREEGAEKSKASFPELFFDLVFVFALVQLSHTLASDFTSATVGEAALLILAVWWVWINTTWVTNLLDTEREAVRHMLFILMFAGILLAIALPEAFGEHAMAFAAIYAAMQIGRSLFTAYAFLGTDRGSALAFMRISIWMVATGILWLLGALADFEGRIVLWGLAIAVEYAVPLIRYWMPGLGAAPKETLSLAGEHMAERCALFVIICLGETILTTGRNAVEHMGSGTTFAVFCSAFMSTVIMWWIYFHHGQEKAAEKAESTGTPEAVAHNLFTYGHLPIVAGIILTAVGEDFALSHSEDRGEATHIAAILGGPALFLLGNIWVKVSAGSRFPLSHVIGLCLLAGISAASLALPNYAISLCATAALLVAAAWEYVALHRMSSTME